MPAIVVSSRSRSTDDRSHSNTRLCNPERIHAQADSPAIVDFRSPVQTANAGSCCTSAQVVVRAGTGISSLLNRIVAKADSAG